MTLSRGVFPRVQARLAGEGFQGEDKTLALELMPLRYDASRGALVLSRRLTVRVDFAGALSPPNRTRTARSSRPSPASRLERYAFLGTSQKGLHSVSFESVFPGRSRPLDLAALRAHAGGAVPLPSSSCPRAPPSARAAGSSSTSTPPPPPLLLSRGRLRPRARSGRPAMSLVSRSPPGDSPAISSRGRRLLRDQPRLRSRRPRRRGPVAVGVPRLRRQQDQALLPRGPRRLLVRDRAARRLTSRAAPTPPPSWTTTSRSSSTGPSSPTRRFDGAVPHRLEADVPVSLALRPRTSCASRTSATPASPPASSSTASTSSIPSSTAAALGPLRRGLLRPPGPPSSPGSSLAPRRSPRPHRRGLLGHRLRGRAFRSASAPRPAHRYLAVSQEALLAPRVFFPSRSPPALHPEPGRLRPRRSPGLPRRRRAPPRPPSSPRASPPSPPPSRRSPPPSAAGSPPPRPSATSSPSPTTSGDGPRPATSSSSATPTTTPGASTPPPSRPPCPSSSRGPPTSGPPPTPLWPPSTETTRSPTSPSDGSPPPPSTRPRPWSPRSSTGRPRATTSTDPPPSSPTTPTSPATSRPTPATSSRPSSPDARPPSSSSASSANRDVARAQILDAFNQGLSLISYVGHGGGAVWAGENILNSSDPASSSPSPVSPSCSP